MNTPNSERKVFFSSDFHFNHTNICGPKISSWNSGYRNFDSLREMNDTIIDNINSKVMPEDILYFLGDFAFGDKTQIPILRDRIKCKTIIACKGNHDHALSKYYRHCFTALCDIINTVINGQQIIMCHYPLDVWENNHRNSLSVFGHCHGSYKNPIGKRMDVGVDTNNFMPYSFEEVVSICQSKDAFLPDHHS